jgi:Protein of unknown function (DUF1153)
VIRYIEKSLTRVPPMHDLPPPNTRRWVASRKAAVVVAVRDGKITMEEACARYELAEEEFRIWQRAFESNGVRGLQVTFIQHHREPRPPRRLRKQPRGCTDPVGRDKP